MHIISLIFSIALIFSVFIFLPINCFADTAKLSEGALQDAKTASDLWLTFLDKEKYEESWDNSSTLFRLAMNKDAWKTLMNNTRKSFGNANSRKVLDVRTATKPHGLPEGNYVVMFYKTSFAHKASAYELVTLVLENGKWQVLTYQVD